MDTNNTIIHINRAKKLVYPLWGDFVINPELESFGPAEFDVKTLVQEYPNGLGVESLVDAASVHTYIVTNGLRKNCLGLREAEKIRERGVQFFQKFFAGECVLCWKCIVVRSGCDLFVPFLFNNRNQVEINWFQIGHGGSLANKLIHFPN